MYVMLLLYIFSESLRVLHLDTKNMLVVDLCLLCF